MIPRIERRQLALSDCIVGNRITSIGIREACGGLVNDDRSPPRVREHGLEEKLAQVDWQARVGPEHACPVSGVDSSFQYVLGR